MPYSLKPRSLLTETFQETTRSKGYSSEQIQVLEGLEPVRKRPGMYIGSTGTRGLHHLVSCICEASDIQSLAAYTQMLSSVTRGLYRFQVDEDGESSDTKSSRLDTNDELCLKRSLQVDEDGEASVTQILSQEVFTGLLL